MSQNFEILSEWRKHYRRFNTLGTRLNVRHKPPSSSDNNPVSSSLASVNELFEYNLQNSEASDIGGIVIQNEVNQQVKTIGLSFRREKQIPGNVIWKVF